MGQGSSKILVVDDNIEAATILDALKDIDSYSVTTVFSAADAKSKLGKIFFNLVLVDLRLPDGSGLDLLKEIRSTTPDTEVIVVTGLATIESAIGALNSGAFAYLLKPLNRDELLVTIKNALSVQKLASDNRNLLITLKELSTRDPLTGLYNYRYFRERLLSEIKRSKRNFLPLSLVIIDIDYFKSINDVYGHQAGDEALIQLSRLLGNSLRGNNEVFRYGGEEFLVLLSDTPKDGALMFSRRLLSRIRDEVFIAGGKTLKIRVSIGLSTFYHNGVHSESSLFESADHALRQAKEAGGNRIVVYDDAHKREMENLVERGGAENIERLKEKINKMGNRVTQGLMESIYAFAKAIEAKDHYTSEHAEAMVSMAVDIGTRLSLSTEELQNIERAAILHDLGKIGVPDKILCKRGKLNKKEYEIIVKHPEIGAEIIRSVHFLEGVVPLVLSHHERFDGKGYPSGLVSHQIPIGAKIISIADVYQALTSDRVYRKAFGREQAAVMIAEASGTQFDPHVVSAFMDVWENV